jgi:hypothetical protein
MAKEDFPGTIFVDFSPKGGPPNLLGVFDENANAIKVNTYCDVDNVSILNDADS